MTGSDDVVLEVERSGDGEGRFSVPWREGLTVLEALERVQAERDPSLVFRRNCGAGRCGSCAVEVNGEPALACKRLLEPGEEVGVGPMERYPVVRDLAVEVSTEWGTARELPGFQPEENGGGEEGVPGGYSMGEAERSFEMERCIECFQCQDVCHVLREHDGDYVGPRFVARLAALDFHPGDGGEREGFAGEAGLELCNVTRCCQDTCPEGIDITYDAIIPEKEKRVDRRDPVKRGLEWILSRLIEPLPGGLGRLSYRFK